jgi:hypothetical protein
MATLSNLTSTICPLPSLRPLAREWINVSSRSRTSVFCEGFVGIRGRGISCTAVLGVVTGRDVWRVCEEIEGVRGEVGDLSESAVRLWVKANNSSFSETEWRRGDLLSKGIEVKPDTSLMSVDVRVEISVSASDSVPVDEASLANEAEDNGRKGRASGDVSSGNVEGIGGRGCEGVE